jgi:hypothetical protein
VNARLQDDAEQQDLTQIRDALARTNVSFKRRVVERFVLAALGSIPWVGGIISAAAGLKIEQRGLERDRLQSRWLTEHGRRLEQLTAALAEIAARLDDLGAQIEERIGSESYLALVRTAFRAWDRAETDEKRTLVANLLTHAASSRLCSDDVVRLFIDWLDLYHETHFAVIRQVYRHPGTTRLQIWLALYGDPVREDSAESDLYRLLIRDLSTGGVIRQERETTRDGHFIRRRGSSPAADWVESAFEDTRPYVLTELGRQFVHYTMGADVAPLLDGR